MTDLRCEKSTSLTAQEKHAFTKHLEEQALSSSVWDLFGEWVRRSTPQVNFFYLKAFADGNLVGIGLFVELNPFDLRSSYSALRRHPVIIKLAGGLSTLARTRVCVGFRNLITANLTRPFFYRELRSGELVMKALLAAVRDDPTFDMVTIVDTASHDRLYAEAGFRKFSSASEAYLDVTKYRAISEYLAEHRSLKKNLRRKRKAVKTHVKRGPVSAAQIAQLRDCVECSVEHSRVNNPCQRFFEENIFATEVYHSDKYIHVLVYVEDTIAGFHTFQVCGSHLGGVLGGFNRKYSRNNFLYERVIVGSLEFAIKHHISRVHYSLVDNLTKMRLIDSLEPCGLYFWSTSALKRKLFEFTYRYSDVHELSLLEERQS
ncbi:MAG: hypothetical protein OEM05_02065 [Myxococcales bacterium]|nr:hypothetical protein [Myxococcales bacterium]MDH3398539.1 hypothetical protein [Acidimicrobiia bacterium]